MRLPSLSLTLTALLAAPCMSLPAAMIFNTVGTYGSGGGAIESSATAAPNDLATFSPLVSTAFTAGFGGVVDFEATVSASDGIVTANYAGGTKSINFSFFRQSVAYALAAQTFSGSNPISGTRGLLIGGSASLGDDDTYFTLGAISGGVPNEFVTQLGLTVLSRAATGFPNDIAIRATFSDLSTSAAATTNITNSNGGDDTFFSFTAPAGLYITRIDLDVTSTDDAADDRFIIDDLAFITSVIPEPSSAGLALLGGLALLARRRR